MVGGIRWGSAGWGGDSWLAGEELSIHSPGGRVPSSPPRASIKYLTGGFMRVYNINDNSFPAAALLPASIESYLGPI